VKVRQWPKVLQWLDLVLLRQWPEEELTEAVTHAFLYALRHMTSLSKFPCVHQFSLADICASRDVVNFRRTTSRAASWRF